MKQGVDVVPDVVDVELRSDRDLWERQGSETKIRFDQFLVYRDLGRARTLPKAADTLGRSRDYLRHVAAAGKWRVRAEAWDTHLDELYQREWVEERKKAARDDAKLLRVATGQLGQWLSKLNPDRLSQGEGIRLLDVVLRHRRQLYGDPTATIAVTGPDGDPLTVQLREFEKQPQQVQLAQLYDLAEEARRRAAAVSGDETE